MEKLILERTTPIQGEPVNVYFTGKRGHCGQVVLTYEEWIHLNKLIREGQENLKRKNETRIEIEIKGIVDKKSSNFGMPRELLERKRPEIRQVSDAEVEEILAEVELDKEDEVEIIKAEKEQSLVRSLIEVEERKVD